MGAYFSFQPAPPVGAETQSFRPSLYRLLISTRSARGGGDSARSSFMAGSKYFNPLRPWGRRHGLKLAVGATVQFQPAPPVGAETT